MTTAPDLSMFTKEEIKETLNEIRNPFSVAVYGSENYFNLGSIVRTCHNFLAKEIIAIDCPAIYEKACMGTHKYENITKMTLDEFVSFAKRNTEHAIVALERRPDLDTELLTRFTWPKNPILLFGSEKNGVPNELLRISNFMVSIPQYGVHNDFNLGVSAAICIYDFILKYSQV